MEAAKNPEKRFWCAALLDSGKLGWIGLSVRFAVTCWVTPLRWSWFS
jgi:hypothetical protein